MIAVVRATLVGSQPAGLTACAWAVCPNAALPTSATSAAASFVTWSVSVGAHLNLKFAVAVVPSFSFSVSLRQVPDQLLTVFHTYVYVSVDAS
jgi:hypothetical protein